MASGMGAKRRSMALSHTVPAFGDVTFYQSAARQRQEAALADRVVSEDGGEVQETRRRSRERGSS